MFFARDAARGFHTGISYGGAIIKGRRKVKKNQRCIHGDREASYDQTNIPPILTLFFHSRRRLIHSPVAQLPSCIHL